MDAFSPLTREALGWYVYLLTDPRDGTTFYVGKGCGNRAFDHAASARDKADHPELQGEKALRINAIEHSGMKVRVHVLRHGLTSEPLAFDIESAAIDLLNVLRPETLLNVVSGRHSHRHHSNLISAEELEVRYGAIGAPPLEHRTLFVSLNRNWRPDMPEDELYERTRLWWKANGWRRDECRYVMGIHNGIVRSVYRPIRWYPNTGKHGTGKDHTRWGFDGEVAPEMSHFIRTSVKRFLTNPQWTHRYAGPEDRQ